MLLALSQDGTLSMIGMDGALRQQVRVPDMDGRRAQMLCVDLGHDGRIETLLYGAGAFIAGYDSAFRPLPGFPIKGVSVPQLIDLNQDGTGTLSPSASTEKSTRTP